MINAFAEKKPIKAVNSQVKSLMPLALAGLGAKVEVVRIAAGNNLSERLTSMGLVPGTVIEVVNCCCKGPMIVAVKGSRVALGRGMALKVLVK